MDYSLGHLYYLGAVAAVLIYDICNALPYDALSSWLNRLKEYGPDGLIKIIAGNKCDLQDQRQMMKETAELFRIKENCVYLETSARDRVNVEQILQEIAKLLPKDGSQKAVFSDGQVLRLDSTSTSIRQGCGC